MNPLTTRQIHADFQKKYGAKVYVMVFNAGVSIPFANSACLIYVTDDIKKVEKHDMLMKKVYIIPKEIAEEVAGQEFQSIFDKNPYYFVQGVLENPNFREKKHRGSQVSTIVPKEKWDLEPLSKEDANELFEGYRTRVKTNDLREYIIGHDSGEDMERKPLKF